VVQASGSGYRLVRRAVPDAPVPDLDAAQRAVLEHPGGPLLVLAGPGTGKTTTVVEAVVARIEAGVSPERILVLTFGRKAAGELRERITARLGRTMREPLARTFHSYCFGVLRREAARSGGPTPRLLSGPEQHLVVRELLRGEVAGEGRASRWPETLRAALLTRGFAQELRDLVMRCIERGVGPPELARLGRTHGRADWQAAARFYRQYTEVTVLSEQAAYDPAELVRTVVDRLADPRSDLLDRERAAYDWVFVDEYQDTDPAQEELLRGLVRAGGNLVVVGDPDQAIYGFRGTDTRAIRHFPDAFRTPSGERAPTVRLTTCRRSAPAVLAAGTAVAARMRRSWPVAPLTALTGRDPGRVDVVLAAGASQEAALIAGALRRAHVVDGVPWSRMAVLVRSTRGRLAVLRRALTGAGVPVGVAGDEVPLREQPGLGPLIDVLRIALFDEERERARAVDRNEEPRPHLLDEEVATGLLTSPLGGLDTLGLRRLRRELRHAELAAGGQRASPELLVEALRDPGQLLGVEPRLRRAAERVAGLIATTRAAAQAPDATAETVLWALWQASGLGGRWERASRREEGGSAMALEARGSAADRDLDAAVALFDAAARYVDRLPGQGPAGFLAHLEGQEIPADTVAAQAPDGEVVRVLTAHAAKGLEWDLVVVAGVQESVWPDLRARSSLLGSERLVDLVALGEDVPEAALTRQLEEERRLFYVALTRARERVVVTAVADAEEGEAPSRFLAEVPLDEDDAAEVHGVAADGRGEHAGTTTVGALRRALPVPLLLPRLRELAADPAQPRATRDRARALRRDLEDLSRSLDLTALVAELRAAVTDVHTPAALRAEAARQLARLATADVPAADPADWWGTADLSDPRPLRDPGEEISVSPSRVEAFVTCELRWALEAFGGGGPDSAGQSLGMLVHDLAAAAAGDPALRDPDVLLAELDRRWARVDLGSPWFTSRERARAARMLESLLRWFADNPRELLAAERDFAVELPAGELVARLVGRVDRIERDADGRAVVVDLKTGSGRPKDEDLTGHPQLGAYQLAVELGGFADLEITRSGGASLLQVGKGAGSRGLLEQQQEALSAGQHPAWARELVAEVARGMAGAQFRAVENEHCDRCPVRSSCPVREEGRQVVGQ
jgi:superfamily I DNA/RNA helicase/RecB family exonuclease